MLHKLSMLHVAKGEQVYKLGVSPWLEDPISRRHVMYTLVSKVRRDKRIEALHYTQRENGSRYIVAHLVFEERKFREVVASIEITIRKFFPDARFTVKDWRHMTREEVEAGFVFEDQR
ncbi:MAG: hypothetical protein RDV41_08590 [Planctomycetota bacterium]|nr:hypothetical protein [Planctomycetota bacterium]